MAHDRSSPAAPSNSLGEKAPLRLYEGEGDALMHSSGLSKRGDHICVLPEAPTLVDKAGRVRVLWGQQMIPDLLAGRYRAVVCGVNSEDNSHGVIAQIVDLTHASQWTAKTVTSYAHMFSQAIGLHAADDREPYILKYDLDSVLVLALLRPKGRDYFTLDDLSKGFKTINKMLQGRRERLPVASVSFLNARANRLIESERSHREPSLEKVLSTMYEAGFRGDVYPPPRAWSVGHLGVFPSFPFPEGLARMREGGE
ncbi:MAG: hypothetical protein SFZ24_05820 [Planctomycetota bacterium]|nr:hypothetical protein [Planctomycetota bacterium]